MQGYEIRFRVYANSQEEADLASAKLRTFVDNNARKGVAVTAEKIAAAIEKWQNNYFVTNFFK